MPNADKELLAHLNAVLRSKLTAINQYFLHARMLKHQGNVRLADHEYKASIDAMKHADMLVEHVLSLGGSPNLQELGKLAIGESEEAMLRNDLKLAETVVSQIKAAMTLSESKRDAASARLLDRILIAQQEHIDFIHNQINPLKESA